MENRIPPQAIETEESIIAYCLMFDPADVVDALRPDDFYKTAHSLIFDSIVNLHRSSDPVEITSVVNYLRDKGDLEKTGGASYIARLMDCPIPSNVNHYIKIIQGKRVLRQIIEKSSVISSKCFESIDPPETVLDEAQKEIMGIEYGGDKDYCHVGDVLIEVMDDFGSMGKNEFTGVPTGIKKLDYLLGGLQKTDMIILGGRPAMGKTSLALNIVNNATIDRRTPSAFFSLEMSRKQLVKRLVSMRARVDGGRFLMNSITTDMWQKMTDAAAKIDRAPLYIVDQSGQSSMEIRRSIRRLIKEKHIKFAVIDYLQLMKTERRDKRNDEIGALSRSIKGMAKDFDIPIIAICQLSRKVEERSNKRPMLSDLRDSGEIEQDADIVMFIYRDEVYNTEEHNPNRGIAEILVGKHREGGTGMIPMTFLKAYQKFEELAYDR